VFQRCSRGSLWGCGNCQSLEAELQFQHRAASEDKAAQKGKHKAQTLARKEAEWQAQEEVAAPKAKVEAESLAHEEEKRQAQEEAALSRPRKRLRRAGPLSEAQGITGV